MTLPIRHPALVSFHVTNRMGEDFDEPNAETVNRVLAELDEPVDEEHPDVSLTHQSEWSLGAFPSGLVIWENVADRHGSPQHLRGVSREKLRELWTALASGDIERVDAESWLPGYG
ncbi:MAG: hypothetical protein ABMA25_01575 [Ilumatobacteraceae bacterium]